MKYFSLLTVMGLLFASALSAQKATIRGNVFEKATGEPVAYANVVLDGTAFGASTDIDGFYTISGIPVGTYTITARYLGYDSSSFKLEIANGKAYNQSFYLVESAQELEGVEINAEKSAAKEQVKISLTTITPRQITRLPSVGGSPDLAQYLQVLPGVIFTGDQGGQLYIRGGAPIQNKCLLDGMTIYNPFHSIGFYSVFETDVIRSADVYTGGFNAEYGSRISAIIDVTTREGNRKRFTGKAEASPFMAKATFEGPLMKLKDEGGSSISFLLTGKHSYLQQASQALYPHLDSTGLPFNFSDFYGKVSFNASSGTRVGIQGFSYNDNVHFENVADYQWHSFGVGTNFRIVPAEAKLLIGGNISYSQYRSTFDEADSYTRSNQIGTFQIAFDFTAPIKDGEFKYGLDMMSLNTKYSNSGMAQNFDENAPELALFFKLRRKISRVVLEPGLRFQYYASIGTFRAEPRLGFKMNFTENFRFKFATGLYSQNLISAVNERDIVNFFVAFLASPDAVNRLNTGERAAQKIQTSVHVIGGFEVDLGKNTTLNIEPYWKSFPQLINLNRYKVDQSDPNYATETGDAYGLDISGKYSKDALYLYIAYSLGFVNRFDGEQNYPTHFDRRHNINFVGSYGFGKAAKGKEKPFEVSVRWNLGSGFPFTLTQGFYQDFDFDGGIQTNYEGGQNDLGIIYSATRNSGRLPWYHRLDVAIRYQRELSKHSKLEVTLGASNLYNRANIFYFDRIRYTRVNQLPILPSLAASISF